MKKYLISIIAFIFSICFFISLIPNKSFAASSDYTVSLEQLSNAVESMDDSTQKNFKKFYEKVEELDNAINDGTCSYTMIEFKKGVASELTSYKSGYRYYGEIKNGYPNGFGKVILDTYNAYYANFTNGKVSGYAMSVYYQDSHDGVVFTLADDCSLKKNNLGKLTVTGKGLEIGYVGYDLNGDENCYLAYVGKLKDNSYDGKGTLYYANGNVKYEGNFSKGKYDGKGKLYYSNESIWYDGEFKNDKYHGKGTLYYEDGSVQHKGKFKYGSIK